MKKIGKYFLYAIGEILLITIGVLIAVNLNEKASNKKDNIIRCQYLDELNFVFDYDIADVESNIRAFEKWSPNIKEILVAFQDKKIAEVDSLNEKLNSINRYIFFGQRSKSKIEELKYSTLNLIDNRDLKNKILLYTDNDVAFLRDQEKRYNLIDEDRRQYFLKNNNMFDMEVQGKDKAFFAVAHEKYKANNGMKSHYEELLKVQYEIKDMIEKELSEKCQRNEKE